MVLLKIINIVYVNNHLQLNILSLIIFNPQVAINNYLRPLVLN